MSKKKPSKSIKLVFLSIGNFFLSANVSFAQNANRIKTPDFSEVGGMLGNFNQNILQNIIPILSGLALILFLAGLVKFVFDRAKGNHENLTKDKKGMLWGLIALFVLVSLWGIIKLFQGILGVSGDNNVNLPRICVGDNCQTQSNAPSGTGNPSAAVGGGFNDAADKLPTTEIDGTYTESSVKAWPKQFGSNTNPQKYVAELQSFLNKELGTNLTVDGRYGSNTVEAVRSFQTKNKLVADGIVGPSTKAVILYEYIGASPASNLQVVDTWNDLAFGSQGLQVEQLQGILKNNGCYQVGANDNEDGIFGDATRQAVINFQNVNSLKQDAIVGPSTRAVIMSPETLGCN